MRFSTGSRFHRVLGEWWVLFQFFCFPIAGYALFCNIFSELFCSETSVLFCTEMKCNLEFSACRCAVMYLLTVTDSEDFICNSGLKLTNFKGQVKESWKTEILSSGRVRQRIYDSQLVALNVYVHFKKFRLGILPRFVLKVIVLWISAFAAKWT